MTYYSDKLGSNFAYVMKDGLRAKMSVEWTHFENRDLSFEDTFSLPLFFPFVISNVFKLETVSILGQNR